MIDAKKIEQIARQITESIPPGVRDMADNVEQRVKQSLQAQLERLDVVTHEELAVQQELVLRLRKRVEALEARLDALEKGDSQSSAE
ncbi:accessory factor UbiK family protein [Aliidiomarina halalkaliphila]|uniref:Ubiquinone biosynthesis accessory factor UbiK n=1 Tax=Aliidiomarina halalkaliphila TaxID=2593535 RepID=A0A552X1N1_9GAMM|nr:accessory factor UbiK family protein [Aliidiomarina halalkaliphila]TRW48951.1 accessory factor UbiK family protein [Aliidiomarina halalkaliphila]